MVSRVHRYPLIASDIAENQLPGPILVLGTCQMGPITVGFEERDLRADHILMDSYSFTPIPKDDVSSYEAIVVGLTLRSFFVEASERLNPSAPFCNCILWPRLVAEGTEQGYFDHIADLARNKVAKLCGALTAKPIFFLSLITPKHNYLGNLLPRYKLSNPAYFVEQLNQVIAEETDRFDHAHFLDINELLNAVGRVRLQDDYIDQLAHASFLQHEPELDERILQSASPEAMYETIEAYKQFGQVLSQRLIDDLTILRRPLQIKAIIVDLDNTMWRGIAAEDEKEYPEFIEGWPLGMAEALLVYKARGGMLAICSKNDASVIEERFNFIFQGRLELSDFASVKINREPKSLNIGRILEELNILAPNVIFVDDDPREIDEVRSVFPDMQFLNADHYDWRRKILMSPGTQVAHITEDAHLRTASVQAKAEREAMQGKMSHAEWLEKLALVETLIVITGTDHPRFARAFELLNKTNQFNTTGRRWTLEEVHALLRGGGYLVCALLKDRIADHGMVAVAVIEGDTIVQTVLSCRAFGNGAEVALGRLACSLILKDHAHVLAQIIDTGRNKTAHRYFEGLGFAEQNDGWFRTSTIPPAPPYLEVIEPEEHLPSRHAARRRAAEDVSVKGRATGIMIGERLSRSIGAFLRRR